MRESDCVCVSERARGGGQARLSKACRPAHGESERKVVAHVCRLRRDMYRESVSVIVIVVQTVKADLLASVSPPASLVPNSFKFSCGFRGPRWRRLSLSLSACVCE